MENFESIKNKLKDEKEYARENYIPIIRDESAEFLYNFVRNGGYKNVLEIGTAIGYSGSLIIAASDCFLTTIDKNSDLLDIAKKTFDKLGYSNSVAMRCGDAKDVLDELVLKGEKFDMVFLDGAKGQYIAYLPKIIKLLNKNGVILADNVLLGGMVESSGVISHKKRSMVMHLREYLDVITRPPFETELIRIEDGIAITRYKGE